MSLYALHVIVLLGTIAMMPWGMTVTIDQDTANGIGHTLREAYGRPTYQHVPRDMRNLQREVATKLRLVRTTRE